ncbi:MAG: 3-hydroxyacyl-CoA dehydrogenase NAD-binding domain-containing protein [Sneathiellaceae bacterium]
MSDAVTLERDGNVGVIAVRNPPVNALSQAVRQGLKDCVAAAAADPAIEAMVILGDGRTFIAGADIREFGKPMAEPGLIEVLDLIEDSAKPVVAAIHGTALGGGLEVALACHYRVAVPAGQVGLPEVKLGLLPGAGGTQRLPRVVGPQVALEMITSGNPIRAARALEVGVVDAVVEELQAGAVAFAAEKAAKGGPHPKISANDDKVKGTDPALFVGFRKSIEKRARGFFAPWRCIDAVEAGCTLPFPEGMKRERELFEQCMNSPQRKGQIHAFFAEREVTKIPDVPKDTPVAPLASAGVIGAGTMGGGIAMNFANAGIPVTILDSSQEALERGLGIIEKNYASSVKRGGMTQAQADKALGLIGRSQAMADLGKADVIVEAVFEEMGLKKKIFGELDRIAKPGAILATNTSTLDIDEIAAATGRPEAVIGTHFFSPANVMRLLEVVRGAKSSKETIATAMDLGKKLRKISVLVGNCDGFVGNRMLNPYTREAAFLVEEGATPSQVDKAIYEFGFAMGPFAMGDLAGLDVGYKVRQAREPKRNKDMRYSPVADRIVEMGRHGQKTGAGYYTYAEGSRTPVPDPEIEKLIRDTAKEQGIEQREISDEEIVERLVYALVNEGAKCLEEGMALRASDIDVIYCNGYGFPVYRGGPMFYAQEVGLAEVLDRIEAFRARHGDLLWKPADQLVEKAKGSGRWDS